MAAIGTRKLHRVRMAIDLQCVPITYRRTIDAGLVATQTVIQQNLQAR